MFYTLWEFISTYCFHYWFCLCCLVCDVLTSITSILDILNPTTHLLTDEDIGAQHRQPRTHTRGHTCTHRSIMRTQQTWWFVCLSAQCVNFTWELSWCVGCRCAWCVCQNKEAVWMHWTWSKMACSFFNHPVSLHLLFSQIFRHLMYKSTQTAAQIVNLCTNCGHPEHEYKRNGY